ncbi:MAG: type I secretion protein TolC, partial [Caulobacteraceae bacterium]
MLNRSRVLASAAVIAVVAGMGAPAWADTLQEAIALAYRTNPSLLAQRANQRALDESIVVARAGLRPQLDVSVSADYSKSWNDVGPDIESDSGGVSIGLSQSIWTAGRIGHGITAAEADIRAGRENLRDIEQTVLASVIQSYADVIRDVEILRIRQANLSVLQRQLDESTARFEVGEITRTDVA